eukprot:TRINITY_DN6745_c0_g2_i1.p1 TRINITY_DN6745_c0_g2~~TRINITY_DN6745_c0_g2_i1.p1  ORF type:complete len:994 (-),score=216.74 TRINITY_DN6745_c0_g2_i1:22-3003(-)
MRPRGTQRSTQDSNGSRTTSNDGSVNNQNGNNNQNYGNTNSYHTASTSNQQNRIPSSAPEQRRLHIHIPQVGASVPVYQGGGGGYGNPQSRPVSPLFNPDSIWSTTPNSSSSGRNLYSLPFQSQQTSFSSPSLGQVNNHPPSQQEFANFGLSFLDMNLSDPRDSMSHSNFSSPSYHNSPSSLQPSPFLPTPNSPSSFFSGTSSLNPPIAPQTKPILSIQQLLNPSSPSTVVERKQRAEIDILMNHFLLTVKNQILHQYSVQFTPEVDRNSLKKRLLSQHTEKLGAYYVFDGNFLLSHTKIPNLEVAARLPQLKEGQKPDNNPDHNSWSISVRFVKSLDPSSSMPPQLFNITLSEILRALKLKPLGKHFFDPTKSIQIPQHQVELWPGYYTSIGNDFKFGSTLLVDITHKILRTDTVLDLINEAMQKKTANWKQSLTKQIVGQIVLTRYSNRIYRIDGIDWEKNPLSTFKKRGCAEDYSYVKYYCSMYNRAINDLNQPLLMHNHHRKSGPDETIYLIPELCSMTGIAENMKADPKIMRDIAEHARVKPPERGAQITSFVQTILNRPEASECLKMMGLELDTNMLPTKGQLLLPERIIFGKKSQVVDENTADWSKECRSNQLFSCIPLKNWILLYVKKNEKEAKDLATNLVKVGTSLGFQIDPPNRIEYKDDHRSFLDTVKLYAKDDIQCVVCVIPSDGKDRYDSIKQALCVEIPIPSQCVKAKTLSKKSLLSICSNIARQIGCKIGGELWRVDIPLVSTMIVGIDVYFDAVNREQSSIGYCATMNAAFTSYFSPVSIQKSNSEIPDGIRRCTYESLKMFHYWNGRLPETIMIYRDGVSDGTTDAMIQNEVVQIFSTFGQFGNYSPKVSVVIVRKRIHTRFFWKNNNSDTLLNPPPGTLVDSGIGAKGFDFFLVSQYASQGTVTPTHYHVVHNSTDIEPQDLQLITYKLCHLYMNWTGTVRVPAPCQYAHKNAYLVGQSLHQEASPKLLNNLYFL